VKTSQGPKPTAEAGVFLPSNHLRSPTVICILAIGGLPAAVLRLAPAAPAPAAMTTFRQVKTLDVYGITVHNGMKPTPPLWQPFAKSSKG
jgi:hypothetical protein